MISDVWRGKAASASAKFIGGVSKAILTCTNSAQRLCTEAVFGAYGCVLHPLHEVILSDIFVFSLLPRLFPRT